MYAIYIILHYNIQVYAIYNLGDLILVFLFANSGDPNQWLINLRKWSTSSLTIKGITKQVQEQRPNQAGMEKGHCTCAHLAHLALSGGGVASGPRRAGGKWPALKCLMGIASLVGQPWAWSSGERKNMIRRLEQRTLCRNNTFISYSWNFVMIYPNAFLSFMENVMI